jgi:hypothetical protein
MAQIVLVAEALNPPKDESTKLAPHGPLDRQSKKEWKERFKKERGNGTR